MKKILIVVLLSVAGLIGYFALAQHDHTKSDQASAMVMAIDEKTGELRAPTPAEREALVKTSNTEAKRASKLRYTDTLKQHADGTKSGVVDPQYMHTIYASFNDAGEIIIHETEQPLEQASQAVER